MKNSEFLKWLIARGVIVKQGSRHYRLYYKDRRSTMPRHPGKEIHEGLRKAILKQLAITEH
ncbi:MAG: putative mRNA interferase HicA [Pseudidiomarina mangrovi]|nr:MAG: putative mRNA interferase HicA [Pseudidiomarina mangrovi]